MRLFSRFRKDPPPDLETVREIQERVREMRKRIHRDDAGLVELFALVQEDDTAINRKVEPQPVPQARVHPDQVPARANVTPSYYASSS